MREVLTNIYILSSLLGYLSDDSLLSTQQFLEWKRRGLYTRLRKRCGKDELAPLRDVEKMNSHPSLPSALSITSSTLDSSLEIFSA